LTEITKSVGRDEKSLVDLSVIVPTHNRIAALEALVQSLRQQRTELLWEVIVVDDGSEPPVDQVVGEGLTFRLLRTPGVERSAARNLGARSASGSLLLFLDDDLTLENGFLEHHWEAHREWSACVAVGSTRLPGGAGAPFVRFRQALEALGEPPSRGLVASPNFCTAQNMSIDRSRFLALGGFCESLVSGEDQDLAMRHTAEGGRITFIPEARAIHHDAYMDLAAYCERVEWGARTMVPFCRRHPDLPQNRSRLDRNAPPEWGREPLMQSFRKQGKRFVARQLRPAPLFGLVRILERWAPESGALGRAYRALLGLHFLRGFQKGLSEGQG
jgi:glycosyltransferase involved in cell wall biosynthesis